MAHYAYLNSDNIVVAVCVGRDENDLINGLAPEDYYALGTPYTVKRTSFHGNIRFNPASIGYTYDTERDAFIAPQPFPSWILDEATCQWQTPVPMPTPNNPPLYDWDESVLNWVEI